MMTIQDLVAGEGHAKADAPLSLLNAPIPEGVQAMAQESIVRTWELYRRSAAAAQGAARLMTEVAETAWGSARLLNDKSVRNIASNAEATFSAAEACARAGSIAEIAALQA